MSQQTGGDSKIYTVSDIFFTSLGFCKCYKVCACTQNLITDQPYLMSIYNQF